MRAGAVGSRDGPGFRRALRWVRGSVSERQSPALGGSSRGRVGRRISAVDEIRLRPPPEGGRIRVRGAATAGFGSRGPGRTPLRLRARALRRTARPRQCLGFSGRGLLAWGRCPHRNGPAQRSAAFLAERWGAGFRPSTKSGCVRPPEGGRIRVRGAATAGFGSRGQAAPPFASALARSGERPGRGSASACRAGVCDGVTATPGSGRGRRGRPWGGRRRRRGRVGPRRRARGRLRAGCGRGRRGGSSSCR